MPESTDKSSVEYLLYQNCNIDPTKEIRLLQISPGAADEPITCKLVPAALDSGVKYTALSYVWGSPEKTCSVIIDGLEVAVTANLYNALRRIRSQSPNAAVFL